jgi:hypothetical protein
MEKNPRDIGKKDIPPTDQERESEAKRKLSRPPKDKTEIVIGPTDRSGPDVVLE